MAQACDSAQDGCLGCSDAELPACLRAFVEDICISSGNPNNCDRQRVYDDAERQVLITTGRVISPRVREPATMEVPNSKKSTNIPSPKRP